MKQFFGVLETTSLLRPLEREKVEKLKFAEIDVNPRELQKEKFEQQHYGFWLLDGTCLDEWEKKVFARHAIVRRAYTMLSGGGWEETKFQAVKQLMERIGYYNEVYSSGGLNGGKSTKMW